MDSKEIKLKLPQWRIEEETGYKPMTTFYQDFSIADNFGIDAIKDTYNKAFNEWKTNYKYITELVLVLNWKIWSYYDSTQSEDSSTNKIASVYNDLWIQLDQWCVDNLTGDALKYYYSTTD